MTHTPGINPERSTRSRREFLRTGARTVRRGGFWIPGEYTSTASGAVQQGPMWVEWEAPATDSAHLPLVFVHGGGGQGTDWLVTPDGRPGWAPVMVDQGFEVYVVDRPGHGRSPHHPDVLGPPGPPLPVELAIALFAPQESAKVHTRWPWGRSASDPELSALQAGTGFMLADLTVAQAYDGARLATLLDLIGPAILVTHSAGAPGGWLAADLRPDLVAAVLAVEPMGPPFSGPPGLPPLRYGLTAAAMKVHPHFAVEDLPDHVGEYELTGLRTKPVRVLTAGESPVAAGSRLVADHLAATGADCEHFHLPEAGIEGNGHGLIFEDNSHEIAELMAEWLVLVSNHAASVPAAASRLDGDDI